MSYSAFHHSEVARRYASGSRAEIEEIGGIGYSSRYWAEQSAIYSRSYKGIVFEIKALPYNPISDGQVGFQEANGRLILRGEEFDVAIDKAIEFKTHTPEMFYDEEQYQYDMINYGECGKYVIAEDGSSLRIPTLKSYIVGGGNGEIQEEGLPNILGEFNPGGLGVYSSGVFNNGAGGKSSNSGAASDSSIIDFDASRSSSIYGNSANVHTQAIKYTYYIVLGNIIEGDIPLDVTQVLNSKVNRDLTNINISNTTALLSNGIYIADIAESTTFILPAPVIGQYNQIEVLLKMDTIQTIDFGENVAFYNGESPDMSETGSYHIWWTYDPNIEKWVVGGVKVG